VLRPQPPATVELRWWCFSPARFMHKTIPRVVAGHLQQLSLLFSACRRADTDDESITVGDGCCSLTGPGPWLYTVDSSLEPDKSRAAGCYGTTSIEHPPCDDLCERAILIWAVPCRAPNSPSVTPLRPLLR